MSRFRPAAPLVRNCTLALFPWFALAACGDDRQVSGDTETSLQMEGAETTAAPVTATTEPDSPTEGAESTVASATTSENEASTADGSGAETSSSGTGDADLCGNDTVAPGEACDAACLTLDQDLVTWRSVAADASGNRILGGSVWVDEVSFKMDAVVRKYDDACNIIWTHQFNNTNDLGYLSAASDVALDASGNVLVTGQDFLPDFSPELFVRKYTPDGSPIWTAVIEGGVGLGIVLNAAGDAFIAGSWTGVGATRSDILVAKVSGTDGEIVWKDTPNGSGSESDLALGIALDPAGGLIVTGTVANEGDGGQLWLRKYVDNGQTSDVAWTTTYVGASKINAGGGDVASDPSGNIFVAGTEVVNDSGTVGLVQKYDSNGNLLWTQQYANENGIPDYASTVVADMDGNVFVGGVLDNDDTGVVGWLRKYTPDGETAWTQELSGVSVYNLALDAGVLHASGVMGDTGWLRTFAP